MPTVCQPVRTLQPDPRDPTESMFEFRSGCPESHLQNTKKLFRSWKKRNRWSVFRNILHYKRQGTLRVGHVHPIKEKSKKPTVTQCPEEPAVVQTGVQGLHGWVESEIDRGPLLMLKTTPSDTVPTTDQRTAHSPISSQNRHIEDFPNISIKKSYADYRMCQRRIDKNVSEFDVLDEFVKWEKDIQQKILKMDQEGDDSKSTDSKNKDVKIKCLKCGEIGQRRANCKGSGSMSRSGGSGAAQSPKETTSGSGTDQYPKSVVPLGKSCALSQYRVNFKIPTEDDSEENIMETSETEVDPDPGDAVPFQVDSRETKGDLYKIDLRRECEF